MEYVGLAPAEYVADKVGVAPAGIPEVITDSGGISYLPDPEGAASRRT